MPFGPYNSFEDCVAKNSDKTSPKGFCAWLEHQITGQWPGAHVDSMPEEAWSLYREAYATSMTGSTKKVEEAEKEAHENALKTLEKAGWTYSRIGWVKQYQTPTFKSVAGVRVFAVGTWTDSAGVERDWTEEDVDGLVKAFNSGVPGNVVLKAGHTPDSFNTKIAEKLDIPVELVTGDHGKGQVSIGRMATLERRGNLLVASFERVPEPIANLIEAGLYSTVSVEIEDGVGGFASAITAVALLGAEEPAVDEATLDRALVFGGKREKAHVLTFAKDGDYLEQEFNTIQEKLSETIKGMRGAPVFRALMSQLRTLFGQITGRKREHQSDTTNQVEPNSKKEAEMPKSIKEMKSKFQEENPAAPPEGAQGEMMAGLMAIAQALGLGEGSTIEDILAAIEAMKAGPASEAQFQKVTSELQKRDERIANLEHKDRVHGYLEQTRLFTAIPGKKVEDIAVELADIEEHQSKEKADSMLKTYQELNRMGAAATKALGTSVPGARTADYESKLSEYMKANPTVSRADAHKAVMKANPALRFESKGEK
ncbi:MAG: hypothetical protein M0R06_10935 [Sphaerochaeta sp.]|nr:hypothetical protein [Sphaerochaeta sp.]MDD4985174.1 hypothetical protein [Dehalococcoidales bacterium]